MKTFVKRILFPGLDLHTRSRYRHLPQFFREGALSTLDVGCGNGALSYAAYLKGNRVIGISLDKGLIEKNASYFSQFVQGDGLRFEVCNAYDLPKLNRKFDQIICSEVLEHISDHERVVTTLYELLNDGGILHLCCPNALHPEHKLGRVDLPEDGGHVRDGYTLESYRQLLEPVGFQIIRECGVGSAPVERMDKWLRKIRNRGDAWAMPLFMLFAPIAALTDRLSPRTPFSVYVTALKPAQKTKPNDIHPSQTARSANSQRRGEAHSIA